MNSDAWHHLLLFFFFSTTVCGNSRLDPAKSQQKGKIVSNAEQFSVKQGDAVTFPCHTLNKGDSVITWNWSGKLVSAGNVKVLGDDRVFVLQDGKELRIVNISEFDRGDISCSLHLKTKTVHLNHTLQVLVPPRVEVLGPSSPLNLTEGGRLELTCLATGFPVPAIAWVKKGGSGKNVPGGSLTIGRVAREDAGQYKCTATNSQGKSTTAVNVHVLYSPIIRLSRNYPRESSQYIFSIVCSVQANPPAKVSWYKDGHYIRTENYRELGEQQHYLSVTSLKESDYGNYSCEGVNGVGKSAESLELKGQPDQPQIVSSDQSYLETQYSLVWRVWTPPTLPILNQSILYRLKSKAEGGTLSESEGTWNNLALISDSAQSNGKHKDEFKMELTGLLSDSVYEVRIRAMNKQGWSQLSLPFFFRTSGKLYSMEVPLFTKRQLTSDCTAVQSNVLAFVLSFFIVTIILY